MDTFLGKVEDSEKDAGFQSIAEAVSRTMNLPVAVWMLDESGHALRIRAAVGLRPEYVQDAFLALDEPSVTGEAFRQKRIAISLDIPSDERWKYKEEAKAMGWKSVLCVPIEARDVIVGVISIYTFVVRDFSDLEKQLLSSYATQIGLALEADKRRRTLGRLLKTGHDVERLITKQPRDVLQEIVEEACEVLGADCAVIYPYDAAREEFYDTDSVAHHGLRLPLELKDKPRREGLGAYIVQQKEFVKSDIKREDPRLLESPFIAREEIEAFIGIALQVADRVLGVLYVNFRSPHRFSDEEKDTIRLFAHQAELAIDNSRLFQQARIRAEALKTLHQVGATLSTLSGTPGHLEAVLLGIVQAAQTVLGADLVDLYRYVQAEDRFILPPVQVGKLYDPAVRKDKIYEDDVVYTSIRDKQFRYSSDAQQDPVLIRPFTVQRSDSPAARFVEREKVCSAAIVPLLAGDEVVGVLFANFRIPQTFRQQQRELIELFASQAAIAIHNARLLAQTQRHIDQLSALFGVSDIVGRAVGQKELHQVLDLVLRQAFSLVGKDIGYVILVDRRCNTLKIEVSQGVPPDRLDAFHARSTSADEGTFKIVLQTGELLEILNAKTDPRVKDVGLEIPNTLVNIPLKAGLRVNGVLVLDAAIPDEQARQFLLALADMAAVALERVRLFEQMQTLQKLSTIVSSHRDLPVMLEEILQGALDLVDAPTGSIGLLEKKTGRLQFQYVIGEQEHSLALSDGFTGLAFERKEPVRIGNVAKAERYFPIFKDTVSELAMPLLFQDEAIGVLNVESPMLNAFAQEDEDILRALASQAAIAITNTRQVNALKILGEIGKTLTSGLRLKEAQVLELIRSHASEIMDTDNMYIALYDEASDTVRFGLAFVNGEGKDVAADASWQPRKAGLGRTEEIIRTRQPILHFTKEEGRNWYAAAGHKEYAGWVGCSWLGVPMSVGDRVIGVIATFHPRREHVYTESDREILQTMAGQAAIAIDNARLHYNVSQRLQTLVEVGQELASSARLELDQVLELIYRQASRLMDTDNMYIALYDKMSDTIRFGLAFVDGQRVDVEAESGYAPRQGGRGLTEEAIRTRQPILFSTRADVNAWYAQAGHKEYVGFRSSSWLGVPMMIGEKTIGMIAAYHPEREYVYNGEHQAVLQGIASQAASALDNARLYEEAVADQKLKALGAVAATLQHRMNNTFTIIMPNLTLLKRRIDMTDPEVTDIVDIIERNARSTSTVINRIQASLKETELQNVNINAALDEVVNTTKELHKSVTHAFIETELDLDSSLPTIRAPVGQVIEVFRNLVDNACQAMPKGGRLTVSTRLVKGEINVRIQDTGIGILPQMQLRLLKKPVPSKDPGGGAGLGLWLSQLVLQSIGGCVIIEHSDASGTTMLVRVPVPGVG
jgi:GAF domain-containing protein/anti-sigma regulatory factor (Ser/Thr protein kinase)